jgi:4-hydroxy-2-oxoheptanedioate aldolase
MKNLVENLIQLKNENNVVGIKQSFEDEGALLQDVILMRRITELAEIKLSVKIGGCEAITDIHNCKTIGVNGIVAPMVETEFALQKFIESVTNIDNIKFYVNIESKTAYENIDNILNSNAAKLLSGIVVGRSDLTKSFGQSKSNVDSDFIYEIVEEILIKAKKHNLTTLMGGNISTKSTHFIGKLYNKNLLDFIESRNMILKLEDISNLHKNISAALLFESDWLEYKSKYYNEIGNSYLQRAGEIKNRLI